LQRTVHRVWNKLDMTVKVYTHLAFHLVHLIECEHTVTNDTARFFFQDM
jgi:hypothetical protein